MLEKSISHPVQKTGWCPQYELKLTRMTCERHQSDPIFGKCQFCPGWVPDGPRSVFNLELTLLDVAGAGKGRIAIAPGWDGKLERWLYAKDLLGMLGRPKSAVESSFKAVKSKRKFKIALSPLSDFVCNCLFLNLDGYKEYRDSSAFINHDLDGAIRKGFFNDSSEWTEYLAKYKEAITNLSNVTIEIFRLLPKVRESIIRLT